MATTVHYDAEGRMHIVSDSHIVLTGPITGTVETSDGELVNVTPAYVEVPLDQPEKAAEIADLVGQRYAEEGHPHDLEVDDETGELVQRPFEYVNPEQLAELVAAEEA